MVSFSCTSLFFLAVVIYEVVAKSVTDGPVFCTNGGACSCGVTGDDKTITLNQFNGDDKVWGCGGAFTLSSAEATAEWSGSSKYPTLSGTIGFSQQSSYDGWEGCCFICGKNLQIAEMINPGWYCEKDAFSTGIWLKGSPITSNVLVTPIEYLSNALTGTLSAEECMQGVFLVCIMLTCFMVGCCAAKCVKCACKKCPSFPFNAGPYGYGQVKWQVKTLNIENEENDEINIEDDDENDDVDAI